MRSLPAVSHRLRIDTRRRRQLDLPAGVAPAVLVKLGSPALASLAELLEPVGWRGSTCVPMGTPSFLIPWGAFTRSHAAVASCSWRSPPAPVCSVDSTDSQEGRHALGQTIWPATALICLRAASRSRLAPMNSAWKSLSWCACGLPWAWVPACTMSACQRAA